MTQSSVLGRLAALGKCSRLAIRVGREGGGSSLQLDRVREAPRQQVGRRLTKEVAKRARLEEVRSRFIRAVEVRHFVPQDSGELHRVEAAVSSGLVDGARRVDVNPVNSLPDVGAGLLSHPSGASGQLADIDDLNWYERRGLEQRLCPTHRRIGMTQFAFCRHYTRMR